MATFGFFSDLHNSQYYLTNIMNNFYTLTDDGKSLDGLILVGDIVYHDTKVIPSTESYSRLMADPHFTELLSKGKIAFCMGNHEFTLFDTTADGCELARSAFTEATGLTPEKDTVLCGYHFITAGPNTYNGDLSPEQEKWVMETVSAALADGSEKPVFLMLHQPVDNTLYGTYNGNAYSDEFESFIKSHPRLIAVSGHTHYPSSDPQTIYQVPGGTTFIYTSAVMGGNGVNPPYVTERHRYYPSQGLIMDIDDETNVVTVKRFYVGEKAPEYLEGGFWTLDIPAMMKDSLNEVQDTENVYKYTESRRELSAKPYFRDGDALTLGYVSHDSATICIPSAVPGAKGENNVVAYYKIELFKEGSDTPERTHKIISDYFLQEKREVYEYTFFDLPATGSWRATVVPVNPWYVEGDTVLTITFTTVEPRFPKVPLAEVFEKSITEATVEGSHTAYTGLIQTAAGWLTDMSWKINIEKAGKYRFFFVAGVDTASKITFEFNGASEEFIANTGSLFKYKDIPCADVEVKSAGEYTVTFKKGETPRTIGITGMKYALIQE